MCWPSFYLKRAPITIEGLSVERIPPDMYDVVVAMC